MTEQSRAGWERSCKSLVWLRSCAILSAFIGLGALHATAAVDLVITGADSPDPVITPNNITYTLNVTNVGSTTATNVAITNVLSSRVSFVSVTTTRGSCTNLSGIVRCDWANVNAAAGGRVTIVARPNAPGVISNVTSCAASQGDADPSNNSLTLATTVLNRRTFGNGDFIQLDDVTANTALPYPSTINVSGLTAAVYKVTCTLNNISHGAPDDLDILLVGPNGASLMLLSDGPISPGMTDVTITFDDAAAQYIPDTNAITAGTYKPANYGSIADVLPPPAPAVEYLSGFTPLSIFNGINPNGDWRLFVYDDEPEVGGWIDGWSLTISTLEPMANLAVSVSDSPDPALPGGIVTYTATVTNLGPVGATGVKLTNQVPPGMELVAYTISRGSCTNQSGLIRCDIDALAASASERLTIQARPVNGGTYTNRVGVASDQYDPQPTNNVALQATAVDPRVDVGIDVMSSRTPALLEQPLIYTLAVTNLGPDPASGVRVVEQLPPGVFLVNLTASQGSCSNQSGVVTCNLGTVASQGRATVFLTCRPTVLGPITNVVSITSDQVDINPTNNFAQNANTVDPAADLLLTITDAPDPVPITQPLTYSIFVTNRGPNLASNVVVSDVLPATLRLVSLQTTRGACTNDGNSVSCAIGDLPVAERVIVTVSVTATSLGTIGNTASVTSQPADPNPVNNSATTSTLVLSAADMSVSKLSDRALIWEGDRVTYTLVVSNNGPSTATGARLSDTLPPGMILSSAVASTGACTLQGGFVTCSFGDMAPGASATVALTGTTGGGGVITNTANAFANEQDLNPANNVALAVTTVLPKTVSAADATSVTLPDVGLAATYPLTINISGMTAAVQRVRVTLAGLHHSYPDDLDILLVGPSGQAVVVMSDSGGSTAVTNLNLTLDDLASGVLPDGGPLVASLYRPADYDVVSNEFPAPAPPGPYATSFDVFTGTDPNGTWKLYVVDDAPKDQGGFAGGWRLDIWARDPMADLALSGGVAPTLAAVGSNVTFTVTVSNNGPTVANAVVLTNAYGSDLAFVSATASQGSCTNEAGMVQCALGDLAPQSSALIDFSFAVMSHGTISNSFGVRTSSVDLLPSNNVSTLSFVAENPPNIQTQPHDRFVPLGSIATFAIVAGGDAPLSYQWFFNDNTIADATTATLTITDVQPEKFGAYRVQVNNRVGTVLSRAAQLGLPRPPVLESIPDQLTDEDKPLVVPLILLEADDPFESFHFSAFCVDTNLVPNTNLTVLVSGTNYALVIVPGTNQFGTNSISITVTNAAGLTANQTFMLGVQSVNDYPQFIVPVGDQIIHEDESINVPFVVGDVETDARLLITGARIYNPSMLIGIALSGTDSNRFITLASVRNSFGTTVVELRLRDEAGVRTTNFFTLTVLPVEDPPTISFIDDVTISEDGELSIAFVADDVETAPANLVLSAESSNPALFRNDSFTFTGIGSSRIMTGRPLPDANGASRVTIFVRDEAGLVASNAFWVTVDPVNDVPFISTILTVETAMDQTSAATSFVIGDAETDPDSLTLTATSTNIALVPVSGIHFDGSGSNRTMRITPAAGQFGWTVLRVQVADPDGAVTNRDFDFFVHQTNGPPFIVQQPLSQTVDPGTPVTLRVIATGPGRLSYQWQRDGQDLIGQTNTSITIASASGVDRGDYRVNVTNPEGTTPSALARVKVLEGTRIVSLRHTGTMAEISFGTIAKQRYVVEFQNSIGTDWTPLPEVLGTGNVMTVIDTDAAVNHRFYRVRVE